MIARPPTFKRRQWLKWVFLASLWLLSFLILIVVSANNELNTLYSDVVSRAAVELRPPKNQMGALSYIRWDPNENYRPVYSICFKNLLVENNNLGIFKTALHKVVKIRDLQLRFFRYSSRSPLILSNTFPVSIDIPTDAKGLKKLVEWMKRRSKGWTVNFVLGNVSEVRIKNFDYKIFHDDDLFFAIQSRRAIASYKRAGIVLRGRVTLETADGSTLKSNHVRWDIENQLFTVKGIYVINRNGVKTAGKNICVNAELNDIKAKHAKFERKEEQECFAKL
ncbi:MAG: hypothetical protein ACYS0C_08830 [Planctomycetota bacterium]|jgi:hypothetical protein